MAKNSWKTTTPPKRAVKPVMLRYQDSLGKIRQGKFVWSYTEHTWVECLDGVDGIGLYEKDGWKVLGWK